MDLKALLEAALEARASDLHLSSGNPPLIRVDGEMQKLDHSSLGAEEIEALVCSAMDDCQQAMFRKRLELDVAYALEDRVRFRVNVFMQQEGMAAAFRVIPRQIASLTELGMPPVMEKLCSRERGLILFTGPTGSGKTTTQAAMIDRINSERSGHIVTVEDPIEFLHHSKSCLVSQRQLGLHTHSFANALRAVLREDPDVILVGEMRDLETIQLAITAAETGHLVLATLHSQNAAASIDRVIDVFPAAQQQQIRRQFADTIEAIVSQTLCKAQSKGRIAAVEILVATPAVRTLIRENKTHQIPALMQTGKKEGMQTMEAAFRELTEGGSITFEEAQKRQASLGQSPPGLTNGRISGMAA
ncbi:type IV pilus twitching motility protein PilT [Candidatus Eisenbacteria bacterium]|uniref:Type IV pilus twitching motility protein PilT n=1 Tax=Eiseniibacteriota bacterium TaxID=2212470 RepID=A0ABV6YJ55_UNCEI